MTTEEQLMTEGFAAIDEAVRDLRQLALKLAEACRCFSEAGCLKETQHSLLAGIELAKCDVILAGIR